jgi:hypothetical protein
MSIVYNVYPSHNDRLLTPVDLYDDIKQVQRQKVSKKSQDAMTAKHRSKVEAGA